MIINKVSPVDLKYHPDFKILEAYMQSIFARKSLNICKQYNVYEIEKLQNNIISHIIGRVYLKKEIRELLKSVMIQWMELQDPIFGENGYP
jgi:hypothetical protein